MSKLFDKECAERQAVNVAPGQYAPEQLRAFAEKIDGAWYAAAFVELPESRIVMAVSSGKKSKQVIREVMAKAIDRLARGDISIDEGV